jgi:hypothetical protein
MGHDSQNLLDSVSGYAGALISPVNETEADITELISRHASDAFEFILDPQLYFPRRNDRGKLGTWSYFPQDFDTADMTSDSWWSHVLGELAQTAARVGARAVCSPATIGASMLTNDYYEAMRTRADHLVALSAEEGIRTLETVIVRLADLATPKRTLEIASVVSSTKAAGIYLVMLSEVKPRDELRDEEQLKGGMSLIRLLEDAGLPVLVGCSSSDVVLWKAAGATSCATGKFANLRRFTEGRFNEAEDGGRLFAYWFEEELLGFLRTSDLARVQAHELAISTTNPFGQRILDQMGEDPAKPWVSLGWKQYLHWFAEMESQLTSDSASARMLIRAAAANWGRLEKNDVFMEEKTNNGSWLRPWLRAITEFNR